MKFIKNLSLKLKLLLIAVPPIIFLLISSVITTVSLLNEKENLETSKHRIQEVESLAKAIHFMQIERGLSVGFASSNGAKGGDKLPDIRSKVDSAVNEIKEVYAKTKGDSSVLNNLSELSQKRSQIDSLKVDGSETAAYYTKTIISLIDTTTIIPSLMDDKNGRNAVQAYTHLASAKENLGQIRANLNGTFTKDVFIGNTYFTFGNSLGGYTINKRKFETLAPKEIVKYLNDNFKGDAVEKTFAMIETAKSKGSEGKFGIDASAWFSNATSSIEILRNAELELYKFVYKSIDEKLQSETTSIYGLIILITFIILAGIIITTVLIKDVQSSLVNIKNGLISFFAFLNRESTQAELIKLDSKDEFGAMAKAINENIQNIEKGLQADNNLISEFVEVAERVSNGFLFYRINALANNQELNNVKDIFNSTVANLERGVEIVIKGLSEFAAANYAYKIDNNGFNGKTGSMMAGLASLGQSNSEIFALINENGITLKSRAETLSSYSESLSTAANEQASSLEETAAAIEEMTSNISANADKANTMTLTANEAIKAAKDGNDMALKTSESMEEITKATTAINDAVAIIENIAFQTNILSLNAAVEAATAGDAGKGFAVVAQEVRNLANRSAEAAKQIKTLAEEANKKALEGREITIQTTKGFETIYTKISQTATMVEDVANASKEQMMGIGQINDAVAQLDKMTQENARLAGETNTISQEVLYAATSLVDAANRTKFDPSVKNRICDVDMIFDLMKMKFDHINFKENNYNKLKDTKVAWTVVNEHQCNLGKWIDAHKNEDFAHTPIWNDMLNVHSHVHQGVQKFINAETKHANTKELMEIASDIEEDTMKIFSLIDRLKEERNSCGKKHINKDEYVQNHIIATIPTAKSTKKPLLAQKSNKSDVWESF